jgi:hypothetical protein
VLANLDLGICEADSGGGIDTAFNAPTFAWPVEQAYAELGSAIEQLKADACATVAR